ncbi:DUF4041 domain-containing protein [Acinetobacter lwoffii]|uniref:DUF4041 domain-containing protein n=1 Tax=Acinetobacter lwoffii TaxID=28090 RepID=UPI001FF3BE7A|nr:DUF4041 domain-containing protein [Acinetobacter lwoffii]MCJ8510790.1 DUF4041 domain-containing protein [Acinetobacter lwoffii]
MLSMALFVLASILICALLWSLKVQASLRSNIQFLQENLDHSRSKLADYETQVDELNYEITQLRVQNGSLNIALNKYKKYQDIWDIEQYIINRTLQAENFVEATKLDASIMIDDLKAYIARVKDYLAQFQAQALIEVEQQARQSLHGYYEQAKQQHRLQEVLSALQHKIQAQRFGLQLPATQVLEQLIDGYSETDAVRHLCNVRDRIQQAVEKQQVASCNYVDDNRRRSTIEILSRAFNCKADLYLTQLSTENLGEMLQALKDDYVLLNYTGQALSQAMIQESYLDLRLEELKFAALVLQLEQDHLHPHIA